MTYQIHMGEHLGQIKLEELLEHSKFKIFNINQLVEDCVTQGLPCQATNP